MEIPKEFVLPCEGKPDNPSKRVQEWNKQQYSIVAYVVIKGDTLPVNESCTGSANANVCSWHKTTGKQVRGRIKLCVQPVDDDGWQVERSIKHEILHIITRRFDGTVYPAVCPQCWMEELVKCKETCVLEKLPEGICTILKF